MRNTGALQVDADEELSATHDYFRMLRSGIINAHTSAGWRSFHAGYRASSNAVCEDANDETRGGLVVAAGSETTPLTSLASPKRSYRLM
jgi:hypothetical protein